LSVVTASPDRLLTSGKPDAVAIAASEFGLAQRHVAIGDVRGAGLFIGVELVSDREARTPDPALTSRIVNGLRRKHVLISASGPHANVLKVRPPLVFAEAHADLFVDALDETLSDT
jgi:4-aminobutyrate aminotransferase-like enzyme